MLVGTVMISGVLVIVGVRVAGTAVSVAVAVGKISSVAVIVGAMVLVAVGSSVGVAVAVAANVGARVVVGVAVKVGEAVPVAVAVGVPVEVGVEVGRLVGVRNWGGVGNSVAVGGPGVKVTNCVVGTAVNSSGSTWGTAVFVGVGERTNGNVGGMASIPPSGACVNAKIPTQ